MILKSSNYLVSSAYSLKTVLDSVLVKEPTDSVSFLLPDTSSFETIVNDLSKIQKAINPLIIDSNIAGTVKLTSWEDGSKWINLFLGTHAAVVLIGSIAWSSAVVYKKMQEGKILAEQVQSLNIKNESLEDLQNGQAEAISLYIEAEAKRLNQQYFDDTSDNERVERIKHTIRTFSDLIDRGAQIHPALNSPEQVDNLFPDFKNLMLIDSKQKKIENPEAQRDGADNA